MLSVYKHMKKISLSIVALICFQGFGQSISPQVINSAGGGGAVGTSGIEVYYNIGEPLITTINGSGNSITQGFLQPGIIGKFGLTAMAFITPNSCSDKADGAITIEASVSGAANQANFQLSYYWSPASYCTSVTTCSTITGLPAGTYSVIVVSHYIGGSSAVPNDTVKLASLVIAGSTEPCQVTVYNGITPNGDGTNDFFYIENIEQFSSSKVEIFNRWGQKLADIKQYNNSTNAWKGTVGDSNETAPSGTYFYIIDLGNGAKPIKGWLELTAGN